MMKVNNRHRTVSRNDDGFLSGMAVGALVGAGLALLFAPKAGSDLRDDIGESFTSLRDSVAGRYQELADRAGVTLDGLQERADQVADTIESGARDLVDAASRKASKVAAKADARV